MEQLHQVSCELCGNKNCTKVLECRDYMVSEEIFDLFYCGACGVVFTHPIPLQETIGRYYQSEEYISHTDTRRGLIATLYHMVRKRSLRNKRKIVEGLSTEKGDLLDYGCGTGAFLRECFANDWSVFGVEPDQGARSIVGSGIEVAPSLREVGPRTFDVITLWHVLEHVHNPIEVLEQFNSLLKPGGHLVIAVPNWKSLDAKLYGGAWAAYDVPRHLWHFDRPSLIKTVESRRFKFLRTVPMVYDSFYVSMLSEKYLNSGVHGLFRAFWHGLRSNISALRSGEYSSLIYLFRKL